MNDCVNSSASKGGARNHLSVSDESRDHRTSAAHDFTEPDDELRNKIIKEVEIYFSDANILKDTFLLKNIVKNQWGFISVKIITSLKTVKRLTKDPRVVVFSLRQSTEVEVNSAGTMVRRLKPMPDTTPARTVVAVHQVAKNPTVHSVAEEFSKCRGVTQIRILRPGQLIPPDIHKFAANHPEIGRSVCAVIEFEKVGQARYTCKTMTNTEDWHSGRHVSLLSSTPKYRKDEQEINAENCASPEDGEGGSESKNNKNAENKKETHKPTAKRKCSSGSKTGGSGNSNHHNHSTDPKSNESNPYSSPGPSPSILRCWNCGKSIQVIAISQNGVHFPNTQKNLERQPNKTESSQRESSPPSSWVPRCRRASHDPMSNGSPVSKVAWNSSLQSPRNSKLLDQVGVLRQPRGPDETKGFSAYSQGMPLCNTIALD
ncbi:la-related protein 6-like [Babylonia areolata]|uniref:la-related protein 6-like n=1 Tax=Babylonia areolata TaxID=304850 RepID=UPI003FD2C067